MIRMTCIGLLLAKWGNGAVDFLKGKVDREEWLGALGLACIGIGIGAIYWPAAFIVVGLVLLYLAWEGARRGVTTRDTGSGS